MRHEGALAGEVRAGVLQGARGGGPDEGGGRRRGRVRIPRNPRQQRRRRRGAQLRSRRRADAAPAPAGGRPRGSFYDPDNVDPDYAPGGGMNASQFRAEPVPPIAPSNYKAPQRREIVDPDNFDPDFQPRAPANFGSSAAAPAAPAPPSSYAALRAARSWIRTTSTRISNLARPRGTDRPMEGRPRLLRRRRTSCLPCDARRSWTRTTSTRISGESVRRSREGKGRRSRPVDACSRVGGMRAPHAAVTFE